MTTSKRHNVIGCPVILYDESGEQLYSTEVVGFNKVELRIELKSIPPSLNIGDVCGLLIISTPTPWEYQGRLIGSSSKKEFALFRGKERENRKSQRHKVNFPAEIDSYVADGQTYKLLTPLKVAVMNISRTGLRFSSTNNSLSKGDKFHMRVSLNDADEKTLKAEVVNTLDKEDSQTEYGCHFMTDN